jgi:hypothetical protein
MMWDKNENSQPCSRARLAAAVVAADSIAAAGFLHSSRRQPAATAAAACQVANLQAGGRPCFVQLRPKSFAAVIKEEKQTHLMPPPSTLYRNADQ